MVPLLVVLALVLGACSPSSTPAHNEPRGDIAEAVAEYARCLEGEGLDVEGPRFDSDGNVASWPRYDVVDAGDAEAACKDAIADVAMPEMQGSDDYAVTAQAFIDCLRDQGVAPKALPRLEPEGLILPKRSRDDPNFAVAEKECMPVFQEDL